MLPFLGLLSAIAVLISLPAVRAIIPSESLTAGAAVAVVVLILWQGGMLA